jgi:hypothetical protein
MFGFKKRKSTREIDDYRIRKIAESVSSDWHEKPRPKTCCVLSLGEVQMLIPSTKAIFDAPMGNLELAQLFDTLNNSVIIPKAPWAPTPHKFNHLVQMPQNDPKGICYYIPAFVFYST